MVNLTLSGQQETLDIYGIRHDCFSFESELGWEQSNQRVISVLREVPYFRPQTQKNEKGVPEGGYLDLTQFILDSGLPKGRGGFQIPYPKLYMLRPDGSTLYTFRDVVFSIKKCDRADRVLNVIGGEQNLAQEKVQLGLRLLAPRAAEKQWHVSYELVKLIGGRMRGRRGLFVTADDVYQQLKEAVIEKVRVRSKNVLASSSESMKFFFFLFFFDHFYLRLRVFNEETLENISHVISSAAMKFTLLSVSPRAELIFDVAAAADPSQASASFLLYNYARFCSIIGKFNNRVKGNVHVETVEEPEEDDCMDVKESIAGEVFPPLCSLADTKWELLTDQAEWRLLMKALLYPSVIDSIGNPRFPERPQLPLFPVHLLADYLCSLVNDFSSYYKVTRILQLQNPDLTHARLWLVYILRQVLGNGLRLMDVTPLEKM
jgi:arginyl-tRNA synthetase